MLKCYENVKQKQTNKQTKMISSRIQHEMSGNVLESLIIRRKIQIDVLLGAERHKRPTSDLGTHTD